MDAVDEITPAVSSSYLQKSSQPTTSNNHKSITKLSSRKSVPSIVGVTMKRKNRLSIVVNSANCRLRAELPISSNASSTYNSSSMPNNSSSSLPPKPSSSNENVHVYNR